MRAAALVADPAGDADREPELQITLRAPARRAGEAVRHAAPARGVLAQDGDEIGMRVALVQEYRLADARGELELAVKGLLLRGARGEVAEIIEPAFSHRDDLGMRASVLELARGAPRSSSRGVMRVNSGGGEESVRDAARASAMRARAARERRAGDHHLHDTGRARARDHRVAVGVVAVVREIDADVDERRAGAAASGADAVLWSGMRCGTFY